MNVIMTDDGLLLSNVRDCFAHSLNYSDTRTISRRSTNGMVVQLNRSAGIHPTSLSQVLYACPSDPIGQSLEVVSP